MSKTLVALAAACAAAAGPAVAHPDGSIDCALALQFDGGVLRAVDVELTLDAAHSKQVFTQLPSPDDLGGANGAALRERLGAMFGSAGWLVELTQGGQPLRLTAGAPAQLRRSPDGRLVVAAALGVQGDAARSDQLTASCRDATWYWFAGFDAPQRIRSSGLACAVSLGEARTSALDTTARAHDARIACGAAS